MLWLCSRFARVLTERRLALIAMQLEVGAFHLAEGAAGAREKAFWGHALFELGQAAHGSSAFVAYLRKCT